MNEGRGAREGVAGRGGAGAWSVGVAWPGGWLDNLAGWGRGGKGGKPSLTFTTLAQAVSR